MNNDNKMTCGEYLVKQLEAYGIDTIFGIPGVHTIELYRGLEKSSIRHITPRHEQGAGFMADGYARATGKPAACFIITGPGMTNIATAMGQAYADSVPMLVISSVNNIGTLGMGQGRLHELHNQTNVIAGVSAWSHPVLSPKELPEVLAKAFALFKSERSRPVHIEIPVDVIAEIVDLPILQPAEIYQAEVSSVAVDRAHERLEDAKKPYLLLGGGVVNANQADLITIAERFDMPVLYTVNAKGVFPPAHPLAIGSYQSVDIVRNSLIESDLILAIGTELGETDYDVNFDGGFHLNGEIIRVDIDSNQLHCNFPSNIGIVGDARTFIAALAEKIVNEAKSEVYSEENSSGAKLVKEIKEGLSHSFSNEWMIQHEVLKVIQKIAPETIFVGDSTQIIYSGNFLFESEQPRKWFNSATGFGTLGYGLPAALGAKVGKPHFPVVSLIGDGGIQFTLSELATAVGEEIGIIVLIWNNFGYEEIKRSMINKGVSPISVDIYTPDFIEVAHGYGCDAVELSSIDQLPNLLSGGESRKKPLIIVLDEVSFYKSMRD